MIPEHIRAAAVARLQELTREYPEAWSRCHRHIDLFGQDTGISKEEALRFQRLAAYDLHTRIDPRFGLNVKTADWNRGLSMDALAWLNGDPNNHRDVLVIDYVDNAGISEEYAAQLRRGEGIPPTDELPERYREEARAVRGRGEVYTIDHPVARIGWSDVSQWGGLWVKPERPAEYKGENPDPDPGNGEEPKPDGPVKRPELAAAVLQLRLLANALADMPPPPPCPLPHDGGGGQPPPTGPTYDEMMAAAKELQRAFGRRILPLDDFGAHLLWRFLREGYTVEQLVEEVKNRG